ncbi:carbohydrate kinase [Spiribacter roseus]|uniref:FGGY-family carbohydrate kinase n=1 Tax=Spiribacter roseus TaxID=1855875 RepID=UPI000F6D2F45|nr:carbohydrate kinase [Spiribacter roseus]
MKKDSKPDLIVGIDAGTSVIKAVAFTLDGRQVGVSAKANQYRTGDDGRAEQSLTQTWSDTAHALKALSDQIDGLGERTAAIGVTGQGDGTWLIGPGGEPVGDAWLWLDARAAATTAALSGTEANATRFAATGTGLNTCQQGAQLAHMDRNCPERLDLASVAFHCKDWLYFQLTGIAATDPSEASFTFGNFRTRAYDSAVLDALGLSHRRSLLAPILEGTEHTHGLTEAAAATTGLRAGTPVCLGYVDMAMSALGAGVHTGEAGTACSAIGSTGVHLQSCADHQVVLNAERTGYVICLPVAGRVTQVQTNMAATLNMDWLLGVLAEVLETFGQPVSGRDLVPRLDAWLRETRPAELLYLPFISEAGERGPFVDARARAAFIGLSTRHGFKDMLRAVVDGVALAAADCYAAMGGAPRELRLSGGAVRSPMLRAALASAVGAPVRVCSRDEAGAAGCAMMAAVAIGAYPDMESCIADWVVPLLGEREYPDAAVTERYHALLPAYQHARQDLAPVWAQLADIRGV